MENEYLNILCLVPFQTTMLDKFYYRWYIRYIMLKVILSILKFTIK